MNTGCPLDGVRVAKVGSQDGMHLQFLRKDRKEIEAEIAKFFVKYDKYATRDPQEWEDIDADLDVFDKVQEMEMN